MRLVLIACAAVLAGCQSVEQLRALAPQQTDYEICRASVMAQPPVSQVAWEERQRRALDCTPHMASIQMNAQANAQRAAMGMQLLQMGQPRPVAPAPIPPTVNCVTRPTLGGAYTTCN